MQEEIQLCDYGCGQEAKFKFKNGKVCCSEFYSQCPSLRKKNSAGLKKAHNEGRLKGWPISNEKRAWSKGLTKETDERINKIAENLKNRYKNGEIIPHFKGKHHSKETKERISIKRTDYIHNADTHVKWFIVSNGQKELKVQGTWERDVANKLTELGVQWTRKSLIYDGFRRYTPDFYLPDLNIFIEVKGFLKKHDIEKTIKVLQEHRIDLRFIWKQAVLKAFLANPEIEKLKTFDEIMAL